MMGKRKFFFEFTRNGEGLEIIIDGLMGDLISDVIDECVSVGNGYKHLPHFSSLNVSSDSDSIADLSKVFDGQHIFYAVAVETKTVKEHCAELVRAWTKYKAKHSELT